MNILRIQASIMTGARSGQVGVLIALALVLRAQPLLALRLSEKVLSAGPQYTSPQRLPFLLWALSQASRCPSAMQATGTHTYYFCLQGVLPATEL